MAVLLETSKGDLVVDLFTDDCPQAATNFLKLCKCVVFLPPSILCRLQSTHSKLGRKASCYSWLLAGLFSESFCGTTSCNMLKDVPISLPIQNTSRDLSSPAFYPAGSNITTTA